MIFIDNFFDFHLYYIFLSFSNPFAVFLLIITGVPVSYKRAKKLLDHMYKDKKDFKHYIKLRKGKISISYIAYHCTLSIIGSSFIFYYIYLDRIIRL
jgi:hypothetical protein